MDLQTTADLSRNRKAKAELESPPTNSEDGSSLEEEGLAEGGFHDSIQWHGASYLLRPTRLVMRAEEWRRIKGSNL